jgi:RNA polymerase subunit RPABC4/transcription elongation factor Spt4
MKASPDLIACKNCGTIVSNRLKQSQCPKCGEKEWTAAVS